jgi:cupin superfamily acireductone dioxygenase involved in methionine salvage
VEKGIEMSIQSCHALVERYINTCCSTLSTSDFHDIISENVKLLNQTNEEKPIEATGRDCVEELFNKYIFSNTTEIDLKDYTISQGADDSIVLQLCVEENKKSDEKIKRYLFEETTIFQFAKENDNVYKICFLHMKVKRTPINTQNFAF